MITHVGQNNVMFVPFLPITSDCMSKNLTAWIKSPCIWDASQRLPSASN